jgi:hypothetical protein
MGWVGTYLGACVIALALSGPSFAVLVAVSPSRAGDGGDVACPLVFFEPFVMGRWCGGLALGVGRLRTSMAGWGKGGGVVVVVVVVGGI